MDKLQRLRITVVFRRRIDSHIARLKCWFVEPQLGRSTSLRQNNRCELPHAYYCFADRFLDLDTLASCSRTDIWKTAISPHDRSVYCECFYFHYSTCSTDMVRFQTVETCLIERNGMRSIPVRRSVICFVNCRIHSKFAAS